MLRTVALIAVLAASACASAPPPPACALPERDRAWVDRALEAWRFASRELTGIGRVPDFQAVFFSADCVLKSGNALSSPTAQGVTWTASRHSGAIALPDGSEIPAGVTSFASGEKGLTYFVMSTPTVWEAAHVGEGPALEALMVAVLLHEASHVAQVGPYGPRLGALIERYHLPDSFNDDTLQKRFEGNAELAASVKEETRLFLEAAAAKDDAEARRLAREARRLMRERQARWFVGDDAYFVEAEDIWLTFEGAGQWTGYQWLIHPRGGAQPPADVMNKFMKNRWWSQTEGFAVVLALERIVGPAWKRHAFGDGARTVLEMLDDALGGIERPSAPSDRRAAPAARSPERDNLHVLRWRPDRSVIDVVMNALDVDTTDATQLCVRRPCAQVRLKCDERTDPLELFANRIRGLFAILSPPQVGFSNLLVSELADLDG
jgi:hypothetical protein